MESTPHLLSVFPFLQTPTLEKEVLENSVIKITKRNEVIVQEGQYLKVLPLVVKGSIRVFQQVDDREVLLYYVYPGETCMMSLSSCFFNIKSQAQAVAEEGTEILCVPTKFISIWQQNYHEWNDFVLRTFRNRYDELLESFNSVIFKNIEERLIDYLQKYARKNNNDLIPLTHLQIASELGTTRVVISRILKQLEYNNSVKLSRKGIVLIAS